MNEHSFKAAFKHVRKAVDKTVPWTRDLADKACRYPHLLTRDESIAFAADMGKRRLVLKAQAKMALSNSNASEGRS